MYVCVIPSLLVSVFLFLCVSVCPKQVSLGQHSAAISDWTESHVEVATYYFFNVTNPSDVQYNGSTPILQLVGPYNYSWACKARTLWTWTSLSFVSFSFKLSFFSLFLIFHLSPLSRQCLFVCINLEIFSQITDRNMISVPKSFSQTNLELKLNDGRRK